MFEPEKSVKQFRRRLQSIGLDPLTVQVRNGALVAVLFRAVLMVGVPVKMVEWRGGSMLNGLHFCTRSESARVACAVPFPVVNK